MKRAVARIKGLPANDLLAKAALIHERMNGNVNFPFAGPWIAAMDAAHDALELAVTNAADGGVAAHAIMNGLKQELKDRIANVLLYVNSEADGDEEKLLSSGFDLRRPAARLGLLAPPSRVSVQHGDFPGSILMHWDPVHGSRSYEVQINKGNVDLRADWEVAGHCTHAHFTFEGLPSLRYYWMRVRALGAAGYSPWSDAAQGVAL